MWAIRMLAGPQAGQVFKLRPGKNRLGRSPTNEIQVMANGVSKVHLEIQLFPDKAIISDLDSSNGTFLNGVRVRTGSVRIGDRFSAHNILFEIIEAQAGAPAPVLAKPQQRSQRSQGPAVYTQPMSQATASIAQEPSAPEVPSEKRDLLEKYHEYLNRVLLPGIYRLTEVFEYRTVMFGFAGAFILIVTLLSIIPMKQITADSIQTESRRRAMTVARALANANEKVIRMGDLSNFSVDFVLREDGIDDVYIVSKDGVILAPPERAGVRPKETKFIKDIQSQAKETSSLVDSDRVAASFPIVAYDSELQQNVPRAHAVVIFNVASLQFDDGRALGLFVQMLTIALITGIILFYFMFKLVEYPLVRLNEQLDTALRENRDHAVITIKFPKMQDLLVNLNSVLNRAAHGSANGISSTASESGHNRDSEMQNLCQMVGYPCLVINRSGMVFAANSAFESLAGSTTGILNENIQTVRDQALQKNIAALMLLSQAQSHSVHSDEFEISGHRLGIHCQALLASSGEIDYYLITMSPNDGHAQGGAA